MKKFIALLLVLVMGLSLCACDSNNEQLDMEYPEVTPPDSHLYETLQEKMGIDFTQQYVSYIGVNETSASVSMENCRYLDEFYVVEMGDGTKLQFPLTYGDLLKAGWKLDDEEIGNRYPAGQIEWYNFINSDGKTMSAELANMSKFSKNVRKAQVSQINVGYLLTESFSINGITVGATVEEIMAEFGLPHYCNYYKWPDGSEAFSFYYIDKTNMVHLSFDMNPETDRLMGLNYSN